jgi:methylglutaconyl-CoA hydratase
VNFAHVRIQKGHVAILTLARPDVRNAFDDQLISELTSALHELTDDPELRVLIIAAEGATFCAGADFNWMSRQKNAAHDENIGDAQRLYDMFHALYTFPKPTIARVQGNAFGGGAGLLACCDFIILCDAAQIAFSEVRIGLVPATIAPFVVRRIGEGRARELFLTGNLISAARALEIGLANRVVPAGELDSAVDELTNNLLQCGPQAQTAVKRLLSELPSLSRAKTKEFTARLIAERRTSDEGQEGMAAFLEKRKPGWTRS